MKGFNFINEDSDKSFFSGKGFYIVLVICVLGIAALGYVTLKTINEPPAEEYLYFSDMESYGEESEFEDEAEVINNEDNINAEDKTSSSVSSESISEDEETEDALAEDVVKLPLNYSMPTAGDITRPFAEFYKSSAMGDWRIHNGIDIAAEENAQVKASANGVVDNVYNDELMGTTVVIAHADGVKTVYSNLLANVFVKVGDSVTKDTIIGGVGNTAEAESGGPSHLHFEAIKDGAQIDPASLIK